MYRFIVKMIMNGQSFWGNINNLTSHLKFPVWGNTSLALATCMTLTETAEQLTVKDIELINVYNVSIISQRTWDNAWI